MRIHDWSRVRSGMFHHFHNSWIYKLSDRLNAGILPPGFYAAGEQVVGGTEPDVLTFEAPVGHASWEHSGLLAVAEHPPQVSFVCEAEEPLYVSKQDHVVVRSAEGDRLVALIEIVSRGNKDSRSRFEAFVDKVTGAVEQGCHVLVIDLFPTGRLDPQGIHAAIWCHLVGVEPAHITEPLTLVSYRATQQPVAYVEPRRVGDALPDMPLFLEADWYVSVPLAETYAAAWIGFPEPWKQIVERPVSE